MTQNLHEKFSNIRQRLDQLGYRQPLGIDSLPLTERLVSDLLCTTESLRKTKEQLASRVEIRGRVEECIGPYKVDNARLVKENNEAHNRIVGLQEEHDSIIRDLKSDIRRVDMENEDLKFFNSQCLEKLGRYEAEARAMAEQILKLQEKNFEAVVHTPNGNKRQLAFRRQRMDIASLVPDKVSQATKKTKKVDKLQSDTAVAVDEATARGADHYCCTVAQQWATADRVQAPEVMDLLNLATQRSHDLMEQLQTMDQDKELTIQKTNGLRKQLELRDAEIERLRAVSEGGRPLEALALDSQHLQSDRLIQQLQLQVDLLQSRNEELERRLVENFESAAVQQNVNFSINRADKSVMTDLQSSTNAQCNGSSIQLVEILSKMTESRGYYTDRVDQLAASEKNLVLEIERLESQLRKRLPVVPHTSKIRPREFLDIRTPQPSVTESISQAALRKCIEGFEADRKMLKSEVDYLTKQLHSTLSAGVVKVVDMDDEPRKPIVSEVNATSSVTLMQNQLRAVEVERDHLATKCEQLELEMTRRRRVLGNPSRQETNLFKNCSSSAILEDNRELISLRQERNQLLEVLDKFERQIHEIQGNVRVIQKERDDLRSELAETRDELSHCRRELLGCSTSQRYGPYIDDGAIGNGCNPSHTAQSMLRRVEADRDDVAQELRAMTTERDSLRERLNSLTSTSISEKARIMQKLDDTTEKLKTVSTKREQLAREVEELTVSLNLTNARTALQSREMVEQLQNALAQTRTQNTALAEELTLLKETLSETSQIKESALVDLSAAQTAVHQLQDRLTMSEQNQQAFRIDTARLSKTASQLDGEKDALEVAIDERTVECLALREEARQKEADFNVTKRQMIGLEAQLRRVTETAANRDREARHLISRLSEAEASCDQLRRSCEASEMARDKSTKEVSTMIYECQSMRTELQETQLARDDITKRLTSLAAELTSAQELARSREEEIKNLLERYRVLTYDLELTTSQIGQLEEDASKSKRLLKEKEEEVSDYRKKVHSNEVDSRDQRQTVLNLQSQCSLLARTSEESENRIRRLQVEREEALSDITILRDLCSQLERQRETTIRESTGYSIEAAQLRAQLEEVERQIKDTRGQAEKDKEKMLQLEAILATSRKNEYLLELELKDHVGAAAPSLGMVDASDAGGSGFLPLTSELMTVFSSQTVAGSGLPHNSTSKTTVSSVQPNGGMMSQTSAQPQQSVYRYQPLPEDSVPEPVECVAQTTQNGRHVASSASSGFQSARSHVSHQSPMDALHPLDSLRYSPALDAVAVNSGAICFSPISCDYLPRQIPPRPGTSLSDDSSMKTSVVSEIPTDSSSTVRQTLCSQMCLQKPGSLPCLMAGSV